MTSKKLVGVTGCPVGIAHTFLAAQKLQKAALELGYDMKVETQGAGGTENELSPSDIADADAVVIACDKNIEMSRFNGKKVLQTGCKEAVHRSGEIIKACLTQSNLYYSDQKDIGSTRSKSGGSIYTALMSGVSQMVPFVITGGLLIALSLAIGGKAGESGLAIQDGTFWHHILSIGVASFTFMIPILSAYIAYSIADKPALVAGFMGGHIANTGSFYGAAAGTGFLGAILAGFLVGYLVKWLKTWKYPSIIATLAPLMFIPIISSIAIGLLFIYVIGSPIASMMASMTNFLTSLSTGNIVLLGIVLGLMQGFDMGGPVAKVAFLFSMGLMAEGNYTFMGAQAIAIPVAPLGMGLATVVGKKFGVFDDEDVDAGKAALAMGVVGISEGAIPFAVKYPLAVIPANMIGSAVACVLGFVFVAKNMVAHGGPIVLLLGTLTPFVPALIAMITGTITTASIAIGLKLLYNNRR